MTPSFSNLYAIKDLSEENKKDLYTFVIIDTFLYRGS